MSTDKTLADVQPGGRVRLGDQDERARFEAWAGDSYHLQRMGDVYRSAITTDAWRAWQASLSAQPSPGGQDAHSPLSVYADSYRRMAKMGDGRVSCTDVAFDIEHNMSRALAARQPIRIYGCCAQPEGELHTAECPNMQHLAARQPVGEPVAYLDLGAGGYMDVGTDLSDEELAALPKGRHMLGIIGTYGVDGYKPAQAVDLGQFREAVQYASRTCPHDDLAPKLRELLVLIDSHTAGGQP